MKIRKLKGSRPLWEGHRARLRRRMEQEGWDALRPFEMVELVLYYAVPRQDVSVTARRLLVRFETVGGVFGASKEALMQVPGVTAGMADWIVTTGELMMAYQAMFGIRVVRLARFQEVLDFLKSRRDEWRDAGMCALFADYNYNLISVSEIPLGETWWSPVNTRRLMLDALGNGARYVYLVIFSDSAPVMPDEGVVARLEAISDTLCALDMLLVDCLLVGRGEVFSMFIHGKQSYARSVPDNRQLREQYANPIEP